MPPTRGDDAFDPARILREEPAREGPGGGGVEAPEDDLHRPVPADSHQDFGPLPRGRKDFPMAPGIDRDAEESRGLRRDVDVVCDDEDAREVLSEDRGEPVPVKSPGHQVAAEPGPVDPLEEVPESGRERPGVVEPVHLPVPHGARELAGSAGGEGGLPDPRHAEENRQGTGGSEPDSEGCEFQVPAHEGLRHRQPALGLRRPDPGLHEVPGEDELGRLRLPDPAGLQGLDRFGPRDLLPVVPVREEDALRSGVVSKGPGGHHPGRGQEVHLPARTGPRNVGHPLLDPDGGLQPLQLEGRVGPADPQGRRDSVLGRLPRALERVGVPQVPRKVDEHPLSHGDR
ncbi:MAG: hypothetical protein E6K17_00345 [Methanobacteriota archaeon]|nr:MAG: hypothetical protein E6K17_00345 [Euryarchaeota archaeon]